MSKIFQMLLVAVFLCRPAVAQTTSEIEIIDSIPGYQVACHPNTDHPKIYYDFEFSHRYLKPLGGVSDVSSRDLSFSPVEFRLFKGCVQMMRGRIADTHGRAAYISVAGEKNTKSENTTKYADIYVSSDDWDCTLYENAIPRDTRIVGKTGIYEVSCYALNDSPHLYETAGGKIIPPDAVAFDRVFSFNPNLFFLIDGVQYMRGPLYNTRNHAVGRKDGGDIVTLSSDWYCDFFKGNLIDDKYIRDLYRDKR